MVYDERAHLRVDALFGPNGTPVDNSYLRSVSCLHYKNFEVFSWKDWFNTHSASGEVDRFLQ